MHPTALSDTEREILERALAETGADAERMQQTLGWAVEGKRPSDEDLIEVRDFFAYVGQMTLTQANALMRGERPFPWPPHRAPKQRPGVPARLATFVEANKRKLRSRPSGLADA